MSEPNQPECPVSEGDILAGKYRVEKILGVGGMGVVVAAMHTELEERVALKFLLPSAAQNPAVVARFQREAKAAAKIKSQHVARVTDWGKLESGTPYIVMEYLEGIDLADMIDRDKRLPYGVAVDYVLQACEAIAEAHAAGFVHRDLKPANLYLADQSDGTAIVKVLDFGISKAVIAEDTAATKPGSLTRTTDIFGSPMYMSPEQLKSAKDVDVRADIWALGVILYELIVGRSPFDRPTVAETFGAILYEKPEPLRNAVPELPEALEQVVFRCLEKDVRARVSNVAELVKGIFPFAANATRASVERTSRVLRKAGVAVDSVPPGAGEEAPLSLIVRSVSSPAIPVAPDSSPAALPEKPAHARTSTPVGAQTRTAWDTGAQQAPRQRASMRAAMITGALVVVLGSGGLYAFQRWGRPSSANAGARVTATAEPAPIIKPAPTAAQLPVAPSTPPAPATPPAPPEPPQPVEPPAPAPTSAEPERHAKVAGHVAASRAPAHAPAAPAPPAAAAPPSVAPAPPAPPPAPAKPAPNPGDDTDGFGDRK
jgi:serine/threonine-protein kinase